MPPSGLFLCLHILIAIFLMSKYICSMSLKVVTYKSIPNFPKCGLLVAMHSDVNKLFCDEISRKHSRTIYVRGRNLEISGFRSNFFSGRELRKCRLLQITGSGHLQSDYR